MKNLRTRFNRFCLRNRDKGIPNLMLYIALGNAIVALMSMINGGGVLYELLCFDKTKILQGQIWRLVTYVFTQSGGKREMRIRYTRTSNPMCGFLCLNEKGNARWRKDYLLPNV